MILLFFSLKIDYDLEKVFIHINEKYSTYMRLTIRYFRYYTGSDWREIEISVDENLRIYDSVVSIYKQLDRDFSYLDEIYLLKDKKWDGEWVLLDACKTISESEITSRDIICIEKYNPKGGGGFELALQSFIIGLLSGLSAQFVYDLLKKDKNYQMSQEYMYRLLNIFEERSMNKRGKSRRPRLQGRFNWKEFIPYFIRRKMFCSHAVKLVLSELEEWQSICGRIGPELLLKFQEKEDWTIDDLIAVTGYGKTKIEEALRELRFFRKVREYKSVCPHIFESEINFYWKIEHLSRKYLI